MRKIMDKNELTKSLFPYMLEVSKTFKMSEETKTALKGDAGELSLFDVNVIEEFVNECIYRFIKDIKSVYTTADITREIILAYKLNGVVDDIVSLVVVHVVVVERLVNVIIEPHIITCQKRNHIKHGIRKPHISTEQE